MAKGLNYIHMENYSIRQICDYKSSYPEYFKSKYDVIIFEKRGHLWTRFSRTYAYQHKTIAVLYP